MKRPPRRARTDWQAEAHAMVEALGSTDPQVASVMRRVPRHRFVPAALRDEAYEDTPLPLGFGDSTISAPHMVALQLEWAELRPGLKVLEVGSGSGYLAALMCDLVRPSGRVFGIEVNSRLVEHATATVRELGCGPEVIFRAGDGRWGWSEEAPFDRLVVSCATPEVFPEWRAQLATPGVLVAPVGLRWGQVMRRVRTTASGDRWQEGPECVFVGIVVSPGPYK